jgi:transcriptional regulator with GAF, ATPase, and Fis domain
MRKSSLPGAVPRKMGRFEAANFGTLFLDEIGNIPFQRWNG